MIKYVRHLCALWGHHHFHNRLVWACCWCFSAHLQRHRAVEVRAALQGHRGRGSATGRRHVSPGRLQEGLWVSHRWKQRQFFGGRNWMEMDGKDILNHGMDAGTYPNHLWSWKPYHPLKTFWKLDIYRRLKYHREDLRINSLGTHDKHQKQIALDIKQPEKDSRSWDVFWWIVYDQTTPLIEYDWINFGPNA